MRLQPDHPHQTLDRGLRALMARLSGGISTHAFIEAWSDWAFHMSESPGRRLELVERAQQSAFKLMDHVANIHPENPPPFAPKPFDHRFDHPAWSAPPFSMWRQGFLAVQDWWDHATNHLRGLEPDDADRTRFMARQVLDTLSPSNFPALNPEIIAATAATGGQNLTDGAVHFARDMLRLLTQTTNRRRKAFASERIWPARRGRWSSATTSSNSSSMRRKPERCRPSRC